ncbi:hypothetical protein CEE45_01750 [Candidatus Heimdallarchaeota archaeon B3_Heim]|nr:MAG: hypothetical protein CEE45_01750 [Candidatus Heimdallarchaeota archaeon B3_Heim]
MSQLIDVKFIKLGFLIGGIYDLLLGFGVIFFSDLLISIFGIVKPDNMIFVYISGLFLLLVGYFLLYACFHDVTNYLFIGFGSSIVRFAFALIVILLWITEGVELSYVLIACTDTVTGLFIFLPIIFNNGLTRKELWIKPSS